MGVQAPTEGAVRGGRVACAMSATPHEEELRRQIVMHIHAEDELVKARRFIAALLAVAEAAEESPHPDYDEPHRYDPKDVRACTLCEAIETLDAAHPGWRKWTP